MPCAGPRVERVLSLQDRADVLERPRELLVRGIGEERVLLQAREHVLRAVEAEQEQRVRRNVPEQLRLEARSRRRNALEELPGCSVDDRVEADSVRRGAEPQADPVERPDLAEIRLHLRSAV